MHLIVRGGVRMHFHEEDTGLKCDESSMGKAPVSCDDQVMAIEKHNYLACVLESEVNWKWEIAV